MPQQMPDIEKQLDQLIHEITEDRSRVAQGQSVAARAEADTLQALEQAEHAAAQAAKLAEQATLAESISAAAGDAEDGAGGASGGATGASSTPSLEDQLNELIAEAQANEALRLAAAAKEAAQNATDEPEENRQSILEGGMESVDDLVGSMESVEAQDEASTKAAEPTPPPPPIAAPGPPSGPPHEDDGEILGNMDSIEAILGEDADIGAIQTIAPVAMAGQSASSEGDSKDRSPQGEMLGLDELSNEAPSRAAATRTPETPGTPVTPVTPETSAAPASASSISQDQSNSEPPSSAAQAEPLGLEDQLNKLLAESGNLTTPTNDKAEGQIDAAAQTVEQIDAELAGQFASVDDLDSELEAEREPEGSTMEAAPRAVGIGDAAAGLEEQLQKMMAGVEVAAPGSAAPISAGPPAAQASSSNPRATATPATPAAADETQNMTGSQRVAAEMDADGTMELPAGDMEAFDFEEPPAEEAAPQPKAAEAAPAPPRRPHRKPSEHLATFGRIGYKTLVVINAPLSGLSDSARGIIGYVGVGTLLIGLTTIAYVLFIRS